MDTGKMGMSLLKNSSFILVLSILFGFIWPEPARSSEILITPVLMLMMTFSLTDLNLNATTLRQVSLQELYSWSGPELRPSIRTDTAIELQSGG